MQTLPEHIQCHTFGYGYDHTPALLVQLDEQGHGGTFTYIGSLAHFRKNFQKKKIIRLTIE
jgi:hypothetical protein